VPQQPHGLCPGEDGSVVTVSAATVRVLYRTKTARPQRSGSGCAPQKREGAQDQMQGPRTERRQRGKTPRIKQQQAQLSQTQKERPDQKQPAWAEQTRAAATEQKQAAKQSLGSQESC
jgi:hypothetical protein